MSLPTHEPNPHPATLAVNERLEPWTLLDTDLTRTLRGRRPYYCRVCGRGIRRSDATRCTYFIQRDSYIKIGASADPEARISGIAASTKPRVVVPPGIDWFTRTLVWGIIPIDIEHMLHEWHAERHAGGEWFNPDRLMADHLIQLSYQWPHELAWRVYEEPDVPGMYRRQRMREAKAARRAGAAL